MFPAYSMFVEYICNECDIENELRVEIIPKLKCPNCGHYFEVNEEVNIQDGKTEIRNTKKRKGGGLVS